MQSLWRQALGKMLQSLGTTLLGILFPVSIAVAVFVVGAIGIARKQGPITVTSVVSSLNDGALAAFVAVAITLACWAILYGVFFVRTAVTNTAMVHDAQASASTLQNKLERANTRIRQLLRYVPRISPEQQNSLSAAFAQMGPHTVTLHYVTAETSGALYVATPLEAAFKKSGWVVEMRALIGDHPYLDRLSIKIDPQSSLGETHRGVLKALRDVGIDCGFISDGKVEDRVELFIGNL